MKRKMPKFLYGSYFKGLAYFLVIALIGAITIPLFFFTVYEGWGTRDSLIELKFTGYYLTAFALVYFFIKGNKTAGNWQKYATGFLTIPFLVLLFGFVWFRLIHKPFDDAAFHTNDTTGLLQSFTRETAIIDENLRDILPINHIGNGNIPGIVTSIREFNTTKSSEKCSSLVSIEPLQGTQFDDIVLYSPDGKNWSKYCDAIVSKNHEKCLLVPSINTYDSGYKTGVTLPNLHEECLAYFKIEP